MLLSYYDITIRMVIALLAGSVIGWERTKARKPAGIRTHALVCLASACLTIISAYGTGDILHDKSNVDPLRLASQIVSGIGFLGAGVIWKQAGGDIRGLTTASNIWAVAGLGIASGLGHFYLVFITILMLKLALQIATILQYFGLLSYDDHCIPCEPEDEIDTCEKSS